MAFFILRGLKEWGKIKRKNAAALVIASPKSILLDGIIKK
jgi:hypothetical protein